MSFSIRKQLRHSKKADAFAGRTIRLVWAIAHRAWQERLLIERIIRFLYNVWEASS